MWVYIFTGLHLWCVCRHVCTDICLWAQELTRAYESPMLMSGVFLYCSLPYSLRSPMNPGITDLASVAGQLAPGVSCFYLLIAGITGWAAMPF